MIHIMAQAKNLSNLLIIMISCCFHQHTWAGGARQNTLDVSGIIIQNITKETVIPYHLNGLPYQNKVGIDAIYVGGKATTKGSIEDLSGQTTSVDVTQNRVAPSYKFFAVLPFFKTQDKGKYSGLIVSYETEIDRIEKSFTSDFRESIQQQRTNSQIGFVFAIDDNIVLSSQYTSIAWTGTTNTYSKILTQDKTLTTDFTALNAFYEFGVRIDAFSNVPIAILFKPEIIHRDSVIYQSKVTLGSQTEPAREAKGPHFQQQEIQAATTFKVDSLFSVHAGYASAFALQYIDDRNVASILAEDYSIFSISGEYKITEEEALFVPRAGITISTAGENRIRAGISYNHQDLEIDAALGSISKSGDESYNQIELSTSLAYRF